MNQGYDYEFGVAVEVAENSFFEDDVFAAALAENFAYECAARE
jgi:hypothetical protein